MDHGDLRGELRQVDRLFHRRVAAADDGNRLAPEEVAVTGGAGRHAVTGQLAVCVDVEPARRRAGGDDQGAAVNIRPSPSVMVNGLRAGRRGDTLPSNDLGAEPLGLLAHLGHQIRDP